MQKIIAHLSDAAHAALYTDNATRVHISHSVAHQLADGSWLCVFQANTYAARDHLSRVEGSSVFPGMNDPSPIGKYVAKLVSHVKAQPVHTMREVGLLLHAEHGAAFHPDT